MDEHDADASLHACACVDARQSGMPDNEYADSPRTWEPIPAAAEIA
jgi:hypothetical protein